MCGIIGYIGNNNAYSILIQGLKKLEYRGYDSAGIALSNGNIKVFKCQGKVADLEVYSSNQDISGKAGIGHTRWATHGEPDDKNAHPHSSMEGDFILVHNGIIENFAELKADLLKNGFLFKSDTDSEVIVNLMEYYYRQGKSTSSETAVRLALSKTKGNFAVAVMCKNDKDQIIAARRGSPLVIGIASDAYFISSDVSPVVNQINSLIYLNENDVAIITKGSLTIKTLENAPAPFKISQSEITGLELEKGNFEHWMLKEIFEQPKIISDILHDRIVHDQTGIRLDGLNSVYSKLPEASRIIIIGCGTSWHAALIGEYLIEEYARIPVEVEYASEFRYRNPILKPTDIVLAISQSGETADTIAALQMAKNSGATILGICNVFASSIVRLTDAGLFTHAGIEIGVASTKAFTAQVTLLTLLAIKLGMDRGILSAEVSQKLIQELIQVPAKINSILDNHLDIRIIAEKYKSSVNALFLGRGTLFPVALEGALKLKEISYIHAEGYAAGEMKHGPIALVDNKIPIIVIAPKDMNYLKSVNNIHEIQARKGKIIGVITKGDTDLSSLITDNFEIPEADPLVTPLLAIIPLQLFSYYVASALGCDIDQPRNLAKSVTVE